MKHLKADFREAMRSSNASGPAILEIYTNSQGDRTMDCFEHAEAGLESNVPPSALNSITPIVAIPTQAKAISRFCEPYVIIVGMSRTAQGS